MRECTKSEKQKGAWAKWSCIVITRLLAWQKRSPQKEDENVCGTHHVQLVGAAGMDLYWGLWPMGMNVCGKNNWYNVVKRDRKTSSAEDFFAAKLEGKKRCFASRQLFSAVRQSCVTLVQNGSEWYFPISEKH
jgi:hypothetical protein